jgi:hypothetical protein
LTLRTIQTAVAVGSLRQAAQLASVLAHPNPRMRLELRPHAVLIALDAPSVALRSLRR